MESYQFEKRQYAHLRSPEELRILAQRWGVSIGVENAKAFYMIRSIK